MIICIRSQNRLLMPVRTTRGTLKQRQNIKGENKNIILTVKNIRSRSIFNLVQKVKK